MQLPAEKKELYLYAGLAVGAALAGIICFVLYNELIIIRRPLLGRAETIVPRTISTVGKKNAALYFFTRDQFHRETQELLWTNQQQENARYLISAMLGVWEDEQLLPKRVKLQSAIASPSDQTLYLSFDRAPYDKSVPAFEKWQSIEAILKTLRDNDIGAREVYFLVNHEPLADPHLDFSAPWPLRGFSASH